MCNEIKKLRPDRWHVYPRGDTYEHIMSEDCPCQPIVDEEDDIVIHNSWDGRELYEQGLRKPN